MFRSMADSSLNKALKSVLDRIQNAAKRRTPELTGLVRLVAVSKTKPIESIVEVYQCGHRNFGENYVQELVDKASNNEILGLEEIRWHFIGHLQRNKCNSLTAAPNLYMVETIDTAKLATALCNSWGKQGRDYNLKVMIQVNTSEEPNKSGCTPETCSDLVKHIQETCPKLQFTGLMTIGALGRSVQEEGSNPDFEVLLACRKDVCEKLSLDISDVELSMGMSSDFEQAFCSCKNTCCRASGRKKRGCPCRDEALLCADRCSCGTKNASCKNKGPSTSGETQTTTNAGRNAFERHQIAAEEAKQQITASA